MELSQEPNNWSYFNTTTTNYCYYAIYNTTDGLGRIDKIRDWPARSKGLENGRRDLVLTNLYGVFWGPRGYIFMDNIFNYLKENCVLRTLARSPLQKIASLFFGRDGHTHTRLGQINSLKGSQV